MSVDTLIIGAGLIGSSLAWHLARLGAENVRVIDFDLEGSLSSSELNAGGVRATWNQPINIDCSKISIDYFASVAKEVGYRDCGYLWLCRPDGFKSALKARETQIARGWPVDVWDIPELRRQAPFIDKTDDLAGAVFAPRDGLINPNLLKNHFREKARALGVVFEDRVYVRGAESASTSGFTVIAEKMVQVLSHEAKVDVLSGRSTQASRATVKYQAKRVVNCAGAWAVEIAKILGYSTASHAVRRQVSIFDGRDVDLTPYGMIVDPSGVYFHPEATNGLAGFANVSEPLGVNFNYDGEAFFTEHIWPALYERSTAFERLKHLTGWAGLYEVSPDESAILGPVKGFQGLFEAHSFSGHGAMHSYAAGLALAELIQLGRYETVDLGALEGTRFERGQEVRETAII